MQEARKARIEKQREKIQISNRIAQIRQEEERTMKKIEDAKSKAAEVLFAKMEKDSCNRLNKKLRAESIRRAQALVAKVNTDA